ncbi:MAG: helix-turn-helix domain-containing protein [Micrococcales bacterium]|nr:helix-turn-helix domain-containing protein [Micrococcales bacterium]
MATQPTLIHSVVRALGLLDLVGAEPGPVTAKRLARLADLPLPTTYHLLRTLVHEGYLDRVEGGYVLGDRVSALAGRRTLPGPGGRGHRVLRALHDELGAAAYLSVLEDGRVRLVDVADSVENPRTDMWVGFEDAAHATALGKAVLAALPDDSRRDYLASHPLVDLTARTQTNGRRLLEELRHSPMLTRDLEEYAVGTTCLAVPLPSRTVTGAVAVSVPVGRAGRIVDGERALRRAAFLVALAADSGRAVTI